MDKMGNRGAATRVAGALIAVLGATAGSAGGAEAGHSTPGGTDYPNGGMVLVGTAFAEHPEQILRCSVIDAEAGYAYFGTYTAPGRVIKVALGSGDNAPTRIGEVTLTPDENKLRCAVIDPENGYAYFGTEDTFKGSAIVKVALGEGDDPPRRIGSARLTYDQGTPLSGVIDQARGYAYFSGGRASLDPGTVMKIALGSGDVPPRLVGTIEFEESELTPLAGVIDPDAGYAYFHTGNKVVKVALGSGDDVPIRVGAAILDVSDGVAGSGMIDPEAGYAYYGSATAIARVVKVALGEGDAPPVRLGALILNADGAYADSGFIDVAAGRLYLGIGSIAPNGARIVEVSVGEGDSLPTRVGAGSLAAGEDGAVCAVGDPAAGYGYIGANHGRVAKVSLGAGDILPARVAVTPMNTGEGALVSCAMDTVNGHIYATTSSAVVKFDAGDASAPPVRIGALPLQPADGSARRILMDSQAGHAYVVARPSNGRTKVVKLALDPEESQPSRIGDVLLATTDGQPGCAAIDSGAGFAYIGAALSAGRVTKVDLGEGDAIPARVGALVLDSGETSLSCVVIDPSAGYAWFGTGTSPGRVIKVALGEGDALPVRIGAITLEATENSLVCAVADPTTGYGYFGTSLGKLVRVGLGAGDSPPVRVSSLSMDAMTGAAAIDVAGRRACFGTSGGWFGSGRIAQVNLDTFSEDGGIELPISFAYPRAAALGPGADALYLALDSQPGRLYKVMLRSGRRGEINASRVEMPEWGRIEELRFFSGEPEGNLRLAVYDDGRPRNLLWHSGVVANHADNAEIAVPIAEGQPTELAIEAGTYWLAWQTDTTAEVGSLSRKDYSDGFTFPHGFATAPSSIYEGASVATDEVWTLYMTYTKIDGAPASTWTIW